MTQDTAPQTAIQQLAAFVAEAPRDYGPTAVQRSRHAILDTVGCMIFGQDSPEVRSAMAAVAPWGEGNSTVVGSDLRLPAPWAAFVNATAAHSLDFDDWDDPSLVHTSAVLVPAILSVAEGDTITGEDLIDAHIVGVETLLRIGVAANPSHYWKGWHSTSTIGAIGAAAAVARVLKLDAATTANALSIATSMAGGYVSQFGTMTKPMHAGFAAKAGVVATALARAGTTAQTAALDGAVSFRTTTTDVNEEDFSRAFAKLGAPWAIEEFGLHVKLYPSCGGTHRVIEAALDIRHSNAFDLGDIHQVEVNVPEFLVDLLPYKVPKTSAEALFSLPFCAAIALCRGRVGIDEFDREAVLSDDVQNLAAKVLLTTRPFDYQTHLFVEGNSDVVTVTMNDGRSFTSSVDVPYGAPPRFADTETVERKFMDCARRGVPDDRANEIAALLRQDGGQWSTGMLCALFAGSDDVKTAKAVTQVQVA